MELLEPGRIGNVTVKNRVVMTPMGVFGLPDPDGALNSRGIEFYTERARGGTGLIMPAATLVTGAFESTVCALYLLDSMDKAVRWSRLAEEVHNYGAKLGAQLSAGLGRVSINFYGKPDYIPVSASAVPAFWMPHVSCRPLTALEIASLVTSFGRAARMAMGAGVDVIEIHGYGGYLLDQFMSSLWNSRSDRYGGDLDGRMRFPLEVVEEVRNACGDEVPVIFKFTPVHYTEGGRELAEGLEVARRLQEAGVDALHVDAGCYESWYRAIPPVYSPQACQAELAGEVQEVVGIPVIAGGKLGDPDVAEAVLRDGQAEFIGLGRSLLADPAWVSKVKEGRPEDIAPCIGCSEGCMARGFGVKYASCAVNPACAMEERYRLEPAAKPRSVLVVGGGPGGMEAAITAARMGHAVTLWEKGTRLGGQLVPASAPGFKRDVGRLLEYLTGQVEKLGVDVHLSKEAAAEDVSEAGTDAVIIATGGEPVLPDVRGVEAENVVQAVDVLTGDTPVGDRVVVAGGGVVGCEVALFLSEKGRDVTIIDAQEILAAEPVFMLNRANLMDLLEKSGVTLLAGTELLEVDGRGARVEFGEDERHIECDSVVLAMGLEPRSALAAQLEGGTPEVFVVGDAVRPGKVLDAVWEGFHAARII